MASSLSASVWISMYREKSLEDQVRLIAELMSMIGVKQINSSSSEPPTPMGLTEHEVLFILNRSYPGTLYHSSKVVARTHKLLSRLIVQSTLQLDLSFQTPMYEMPCMIVKAEETALMPNDRPEIIENLVGCNFDHLWVQTGDNSKFLFKELIEQDESYNKVMLDWGDSPVVVPKRHEEPELANKVTVNGNQFATVEQMGDMMRGLADIARLMPNGFNIQRDEHPEQNEQEVTAPRLRRRPSVVHTVDNIVHRTENGTMDDGFGSEWEIFVTYSSFLRKMAIDMRPSPTSGCFGIPCTAEPNMMVSPEFSGTSCFPMVKPRVAPSEITS